MQFNAKVYQNESERLIAICDEDINGAKLRHNGVNIIVKKEFYGNDIFTLDEVLFELSRCTSINAFGSNICNLLVKQEIIHPSTILWISHDDTQVGHVILIK